jgi:hypothetical protein
MPQLRGNEPILGLNKLPLLLLICISLCVYEIIMETIGFEVKNGEREGEKVDKGCKYMPK